MGQNRAQRQIFQKTKGNVQIKKWSKIWSFRAKNWPKIAKKKKKISKKFEFKAKTGAKMTKNKTILSQNWSFRAKLVTALFSQNWGKEKRFLKKKIANIGAKKAKKQAKNFKNQYINGVFETEKV